MVAGMAPLSRTRRSTSRQVSTLVGGGIPWVRIAVSSATIGFPYCKACSTSSDSTSPIGWEVALSNRSTVHVEVKRQAYRSFRRHGRDISRMAYQAPGDEPRHGGGEAETKRRG